MRFIIELDGVLTELATGWHRAHVETAVNLGWSTLDQPTFWRLMRTRGFDADFLPGAKPGKYKHYRSAFDASRETDAIVATFAPRPDAGDALRSLRHEGSIVGASLGANLSARKRTLALAEWGGWFEEIQPLHADPRRRPIELRVLAGEDTRTVVVGASDAMIRSADAADLFAVGVSTGACTPARLHQAGASLVYRSLQDLVNATRNGAPELVSAGLPPEPLGGAGH